MVFGSGTALVCTENSQYGYSSSLVVVAELTLSARLLGIFLTAIQAICLSSLHDGQLFQCLGHVLDLLSYVSSLFLSFLALGLVSFFLSSRRSIQQRSKNHGGVIGDAGECLTGLTGLSGVQRERGSRLWLVVEVNTGLRLLRLLLLLCGPKQNSLLAKG